jgi:hypothetical protein
MTRQNLLTKPTKSPTNLMTTDDRTQPLNKYQNMSGRTTSKPKATIQQNKSELCSLLLQMSKILATERSWDQWIRPSAAANGEKRDLLLWYEQFCDWLNDLRNKIKKKVNWLLIRMLLSATGSHIESRQRTTEASHDGKGRKPRDPSHAISIMESMKLWCLKLCIIFKRSTKTIH